MYSKSIRTIRLFFAEKKQKIGQKTCKNDISPKKIKIFEKIKGNSVFI